MKKLIPLICIQVLTHAMHLVPSLMDLCEPAAAAQLEQHIERWSDRWADSIEHVSWDPSLTHDEHITALSRMYHAAWESMTDAERDCRCQLSKVHAHVNESRSRGEFKRVWLRLLEQVYAKSSSMQQGMNQVLHELVVGTTARTIDEQERRLRSLPRIMKKIMKRSAARIYGWEGTIDKSLAKPCQPKQIALSSEYLIINGCTRASLFRVNVYDLATSNYSSLIDAHECARTIHIYGHDLLVCGMDDGSITFWHVGDGKRLLSINPEQGPIRCIISIPDGIVCGTQKGSLVKVPLSQLHYSPSNTNQPLSPKLLPHECKVELLHAGDDQGAIVSLDACGYHVAAIAGDGELQFWDARVNECLKRIRCDSPVHQVIALNKRCAAIADNQGSLIYLDQDDDYKQRKSNCQAKILRMARLDGHITFTTSDDPSIVVWDPYTDTKIARIEILQKSPIEYVVRDTMLALAVNSCSVMLKQAIPLKKILNKQLVSSFKSNHDIELFLHGEYARRHDCQNDSDFMSSARNAIVPYIHHPDIDTPTHRY